jgi:hypothetical protein
MRLGPHDILLVLDLHFSENRAWLGPRDVRNHRFYHFKDAANRAINHIIVNDAGQGRALILQNLSPAIFRAAMQSREQAKYLAVGLATLALTFLCRSESCREWLRCRRFG